MERGVPQALMAPSLVLCNAIGPPGLLLYAALCGITGRGLPAMGYEAEEESV